MPPMPDCLPDWLIQGDEPPIHPADIWPEDVLTEEEWDRSWFDRQIANGRTPRRTQWGWTTEEQA